MPSIAPAATKDVWYGRATDASQSPIGRPIIVPMAVSGCGWRARITPSGATSSTSTPGYIGSMTRWKSAKWRGSISAATLPPGTAPLLRMPRAIANTVRPVAPSSKGGLTRRLSPSPDASGGSAGPWRLIVANVS